MSKKKLIILFLIGIFLIILYFAYTSFFQKRISNIPSAFEAKEALTNEIDIPKLSVIADNLEIPWSLVFLPDKSILFTERPGRVRLIDNNGVLNPIPIAVINDALHKGEGGLLGITIHPDFIQNHFVYLYYTYANNKEQTLNRVARFKFESNSLLEKTIIVNQIPGASNHNGGRIKFGPASQRGEPDGFLYITTGDSQNPSLAQDINSLAGKVLRVDDNGKPAPDNPFDNQVFSYGHRNPQGIAWDDQGNLWATEHGPSTVDEINIAEKGKNYGWPEISGNQTQVNMETSILNSGSDTWAPAGVEFLNGSLFFAGLRGKALYEYNITNKTLMTHLKGEIGRIRDVVLGHDNLLYITTSNRDGRGIPDGTNDKIIRVNPTKL